MEHRQVARSASPRGELVLRERQDHDHEPVLELRANGLFVMDTAETGSERALATAALAASGPARHVLVGGLGLGFTLREVLADPQVRRCTVVEIEPALVTWMRDGTIPHGPALLADERVEVVVADVADHLPESADAAYDVVLLDVDNGPANLVHAQNAALYGAPLLAQLHRVCRRAVVIWSAARSPDLLTAMQAVFSEVEEIRCPVDLQGRAEDYWLYAARRRP